MTVFDMINPMCKAEPEIDRAASAPGKKQHRLHSTKKMPRKAEDIIFVTPGILRKLIAETE